MSRNRLVAALALIPLVLAACSTGSATQQVTTTGQPAAAATAPDVPESLQPSTETSPSPDATATVDPNAKVIYLTFDDGPWVTYTQEILDILEKNDVTATFFVVGEMAQQHMGLIRKEYEAGHAIGNHTWNHANLTEISDDQIRQEIRSTHKLIGDMMSPCLRPPYGATDDHVRAITKQEGFRTVLWTEWAVDWTQPSVDQLVQYLKDDTYDKTNILLHDGGGDRPNTVEAVRIMIPKWKKQGYTFAAVPACTKPAP